MFNKVLVANRGEIALRVIRACRELEISTAAIVSDPDRDAPFARAADEVHELGGAAPADSYLRQDRIIAIARRCRADAIHPGYGFLSERVSFADRCRRAGVAFIGPSGRAMTLLGNKLQSRRLAQTVDVPVVPGGKDPRRIGFPLLVKAAAGGGGRGMRVVRKASDLDRALREASAEAKGAFGDGTLFVEKYIERPRHIEIQLLADATGNVVHLFERECSVQRRHQKLIEESPSAIPEKTRQAIGEAACRMARAAGYTNAGTAEFLLAPDGAFYFLEVNARLQVEHPVTEMVTGIDIVQQQIRVAAGEPLSFTQDNVRRRGHAIECRIVAEDPYDGFAPTSGRIEAVRFPSGPGVRVDSALADGLEISPYYDSLIAKLICWADDRPRAIRRMLRALGELRVVGVPTPVPFLRWVLESADFRNRRIDVGWVERQWKEKPDKKLVARAALLAAALDQSNGACGSPERVSAWELAVREP